MTVKFICFGALPSGTKTRWGGWADVLTERADGALVIKTAISRMGFPSGSWSKRKNLGDYSVFDVDFSQRFSPRRFL